MTMRWWIAFLALGFACKNDKLCPSAKYDFVMGDPGGGTCTGAACDSPHNSPHTNMFPVNGLYSDQCNADQMKLEKKSLEGGGCHGSFDLRLGSDRQSIVGVNGDKTCSHTDLIGATFEVGGPTKVATLQIIDVKQLVMFGQTYEGYKIALKSDGALLCGFDASIAFDSAVGSDPHHTQVDCDFIDGSAGDGSDYDMYAVAMPGPIFSAIDASVLPYKSNPAFFNLACSGDALAKSMIWGLNGSAAETTAAMRMITARYFANYQPFTKKGLPLTFDGSDGAEGSGSGLQVEAEWDASGHALCIGQPRLISYVDELKSTPDKLPQCVQPPRCRHSAGATPIGSDCGSDDGWKIELRTGSAGVPGIPVCGSEIVANGVWETTYSGDPAKPTVLRRRHK